MKSYRKELWFNLPTCRGFVNITPDVETYPGESGIQEGLALVSAMHITAPVFINNDESGLQQDHEKWLEKLAPHEPVNQYRHNDTGEDNADAHMKRQIMVNKKSSWFFQEDPMCFKSFVRFCFRFRQELNQTR